MKESIPDTANGPLYQAWKRLHDRKLETDLACARAERAMRRKTVTVPAEPQYAEPVRPVRTATEAVRQVIQTKVNGAPVFRSYLREESQKLFPMNEASFCGAINEARRSGLIVRGEHMGQWRKTETRNA